jgi:hypothetical protein
MTTSALIPTNRRQAAKASSSGRAASSPASSMYSSIGGSIGTTPARRSRRP